MTLKTTELSPVSYLEYSQIKNKHEKVYAIYTFVGTRNFYFQFNIEDSSFQKYLASYGTSSLALDDCYNVGGEININNTQSLIVIASNLCIVIYYRNASSCVMPQLQISFI